MRCSTQYGYMMSTAEDYDLMQDKLFKKVRFRLTENFCNWIYEEPDAELDPIYFYSSLKRYGIKMKDKVELLSDKNIGKINKRYTIEKIESRMELPKCRPMLIIG